MAGFQLSRTAFRDLEQIWQYIAVDNEVAARRVLDEFYVEFERLAENPLIYHRRSDLTKRDVRFWRLPSHLIVYRAEKTLRIFRVLHGKRNLKRILK